MMPMENSGFTDTTFQFVQKPWHIGKPEMPVFLSRGEDLDYVIGCCAPQGNEWVARLEVYPNHQTLGSRPTRAEAMALLWGHREAGVGAPCL